MRLHRLKANAYIDSSLASGKGVDIRLRALQRRCYYTALLHAIALLITESSQIHHMEREALSLPCVGTPDLQQWSGEG